MEYLPVGLFAIAALGGVTLAVMKFMGRQLPIPLAMLHGIFAAAGIVTLVLNVVQTRTNTAMNVSLLLFVLAAAGGFVLFSQDLMRRSQPSLLIAAHGLTAAISLIMLLVAVLR